MPGTSNFKVFNEQFQNVMTDEEYATEAQRTGGLTDGIAKTRMHNKLFRQTSIMAAAIAQHMANKGHTVTDEDLPALVSAVSDAFSGISQEEFDDLADAVGDNAADLAAHKAENATETVKGHIEIATQAEVTAGTDAIRAVVPKYLSVELAKRVPNANIANNLITTVTGLVLDASQGKILQDQINTKTMLDLASYVSSNYTVTGANIQKIGKRCILQGVITAAAALTAGTTYTVFSGIPSTYLPGLITHLDAKVNGYPQDATLLINTSGLVTSLVLNANIPSGTTIWITGSYYTA
ncbi:hypothetical protein HMPREF0322_00388 [Desulfitobacterium hafniense DP7]|uniref:Uncharacterized protein n=1 Tax=Desulfitobacterium hafniense DP7 TaxID=537010 RepID=G9XHG3_DESHA|nr:hypothetical protein [Desulfitobacterium hafniense]EHL08965.1 hypothetical protein HMPREF0322_00388 [Desulfitobacterium hafniense DP7]